MSVRLTSFPATEIVQRALESALGDTAGLARTIVIVNRQPSPMSSSFPTEILTCRLDGTQDVHVLVKYGVGRVGSGCGHRGGVPYESQVYGDLLAHLPLPTAPFFGSFRVPDSDEAWLFLGFLHDALRVCKFPAPLEAMVGAARWVGAFHAQAEALMRDRDVGFLNVYDGEYFAGWARRASAFAGPWHARLPWLERVCERFADVIPLLLAPPSTIVHGECYPQNVLVRDGMIYPVDWESAAIGTGEIDLASLTEGWRDDIVRQCEAEYCRVRWPGNIPDGFQERLLAARIYLHLRWLGDDPEYTVQAAREPQFERLRRDAMRLGLM